MWKYKIFECVNIESAIMGCFCTPCLFGINQSKLDFLDGMPTPSCIPGCLSFYVINTTWQIIGIMYATSIYYIIGFPIDPIILQSVSILCGSVGTGLYGAKTRKRIRDKYGINGDKNRDCIVYACLPQCAVIQEAQEIEEQVKCNNEYLSIPISQHMDKN
tara:strand:- start:460 stop:939 length:480 start_codon:yes stop_codon:yes gene_type:complete